MSAKSKNSINFAPTKQQQTLTHTTMKTFTAIYNTAKFNGIQYSFKADSIDAAVDFASGKFEAFPNLAILLNDDRPADYGRIVYLNGHICDIVKEEEE